MPSFLRLSGLASGAIALFLAVNSVHAAPQTAPVVCPANSHTISSTKCGCDEGYYSGGTNANGSLKRCYPVCDTNYYPQLTNVGDPTGLCVRCPAYSYSTGAQASCKCDASIAPRLTTTAAGQDATCKCPVNSALASGKCECKAGWRSGGTTADGLLKFCVPVCAANSYPDIVSSPFSVPGTCSKCPTYSTSTGSQSSCTCAADHPVLSTTPAGQARLCACPANASRATTTSACTCTSGFYARGTYGDGSLRTCLPVCSADSYPVLGGDGKPTGACTPCPERSTSSGSTFQCTCDPHTSRLTTTGAGQTSKCSACSAGFVTSDDGKSCVTAPITE